VGLDLRRVARVFGGGRSGEATACARALTVLAGRTLSVELLPGGTAELTRAALTARAIAVQDPVPWPCAVMRQLDPDDPAFLPAIGLHPVLAARDRSRLGLPGRPRTAWVDPAGWSGLEGGPSVTVWFADGAEASCVGRQPGFSSAGAAPVLQRRSPDGVGLETITTVGALELRLEHWPVVVQGALAWAIQATLLNLSERPSAARLAFAIRPAGFDGVAPIFQLDRDAQGTWKADETPLLAFSRPGDELLTGRHSDPDPWLRFSGLAPAQPVPVGRIELHCGAGLATAAEVWRIPLQPGERTSRLAILGPPTEAASALTRTNGASLRRSAAADRDGLLASGCQIELREHTSLLAAARDRLLDEPVRGDLAACLGAVALARLGFVRRAEERIGGWLDEVGRDGRIPGSDHEEGAVLAWAAAELRTWTGDRGWAREHDEGWLRILDRLSEGALEPGGHALFGPDGSIRWTTIWATAALLSSAAALRGQREEHGELALAGGRLREGLLGVLGEAPWSASPGRAPDGSSAALLAAVWLGLVPPDAPAVTRTLDHVRARCWHGGGVLLQGGAHVGATSLFAAVEARLDPRFDPLARIAPLASPTGALPTARHPARGAVGEGDDALSAALFVLLVLDCVQVDRGVIAIGRGLSRARDLPTPYGRLDVDLLDDGRRVVTGRWRGAPPQVLIRD
jgi:hypothetical protein